MNKTSTPAEILVVDDNPENISILSDLLRGEGYVVRSNRNGVDALVAVRQSLPDLILLDIMMPKMNGYEVCQELKADSLTREVPVIFISALAELHNKLNAFSAGGVDYISKPFHLEEVLIRVKTQLAMRQLQHDLQATNAALAAQLEEVKNQNAELDAFAHTVAHDLKNPLGLLIGHVELLANDMDEVQQADTLDELRNIVRIAVKMDNIIDELMLLAGIRRRPPTFVPLDMASIVHEAQGRLVSMIERAGAQIFIPDYWPKALGYAPWIEEVWANYLNNAIKYGGNPPIIETGATSLSDGMIQFWVKDNGIGIPADQIDRLFAPFERLGQIKTQGHGLGLSIVRRIIEKLGGQVGVESTPGAGSVFSFTLPAADIHRHLVTPEEDFPTT